MVKATVKSSCKSGHGQPYTLGLTFPTRAVGNTVSSATRGCCEKRAVEGVVTTVGAHRASEHTLRRSPVNSSDPTGST